MKTKIVAISGHIGSGKDEFAKIMAELSVIGVERHAFADKVRDITELLTGYKMKLINKAGEPFINNVYNYTQEDKNVFLPIWNKTIGQCLQQIGTEVFRYNFDPDTWVKALIGTANRCADDGYIFVCPDCRFPNEADAILEMGGIVIRLEGDPLNIRKNSTRDLNHPSETALDNYTRFTKTIRNVIPDINIFRIQVNEIIREYVYQ